MAGPLADLVVLDLTRALAGPHCGQMLGDLGARVIKVETPGGGDDSRSWGPPFVGPDDDISTYFLSCNRNKESVTADLKDGAGKEFLTQLIGRADVLIENFRTGVMDRLGFGIDRMAEINPRLVVLSITGFGHDGPEGGRPGYDQIAQGEGGIMSITGTDADHPQRVGVPIADLLAGMYGAYGILAALHERDRTGKGAVVRTSLLAAMVGVHAFQGTRYTVAGEVATAQGNHHPAITPYGAFRTGDGTVQLSVGSQALWRRFAPLVRLDPDDPRFATNSLRTARRDDLIAIIEAVFAQGSSEFWLGELEAIGVPAGAIRTLQQVYDWDQTASQGLLVDVEHPVLGTITLPGPPLRFDGSAPVEHRPPPALGEHNESVRAWLETAEHH
ncbi:MAG: CoA transferase [Geodermatophilaceae bacterium]|nr:CoA transferase [Geodermatophilaceae bacterium]